MREQTLYRVKYINQVSIKLWVMHQYSPPWTWFLPEYQHDPRPIIDEFYVPTIMQWRHCWTYYLVLHETSNRGILCWLGQHINVLRAVFRPESQLCKAIANMLSLLIQRFKADTDAVLLAYMLPVAKLKAVHVHVSGQVRSMSTSLAAAVVTVVITAVSIYRDLLQRPHNRRSQILLLCCKHVLSQEQNLNC